MDYEALKNRLTNAKPFLKEEAMERINALADALEITQEQADELVKLAVSNGLDVMPEDFKTRLSAVEASTDELTLAVADLMYGGI